jgi:plasmid rolling circle replication initiator protein Rep
VIKNNITPKAAQVKPENYFKKQLRKFTENKQGAMRLAQSYLKTDLPWRFEWAGWIQNCGKKIIFARNLDNSLSVVAAIFCQKRLCPLCSWRRSLKTYKNIYDIVTDEDFEKTNAEFIMLTLTAKNCKPEELKETLNRFFMAWRILTENKNQPFRQSFLGTFRALEITYNQKRKDYHPHFHVLAAVSPDYFKKGNPKYIKHAELRELWQGALNRAKKNVIESSTIRQLDAETFGARFDLGTSLSVSNKYRKEHYEKIDYLPEVRIEKIRKGTAKGVAEVAKYTVKPGTYVNRPEIVACLDNSLQRRRLIAYGGLFADIQKKLKIKDEPVADVDFTTQKSTVEVMRNPLIQKIVADWDFSLGAYKISPYTGV